MLKITPEASDHLRRIRTDRGFGERMGARFVRGTKGNVGLTFAVAPEPGDQVLAGSALPIYVAEDVNATLQRSLIDVAVKGESSRLVLRPQADAAP